MKPEGDGQPSRHPALTGSAHRSGNTRSTTSEAVESSFYSTERLSGSAGGGGRSTFSLEVEPP